jgi:hypothetical protein
VKWNLRLAAANRSIAGFAEGAGGTTSPDDGEVIESVHSGHTLFVENRFDTGQFDRTVAGTQRGGGCDNVELGGLLRGQHGRHVLQRGVSGAGPHGHVVSSNRVGRQGWSPIR